MRSQATMLAFHAHPLDTSFTGEDSRDRSQGLGRQAAGKELAVTVAAPHILFASTGEALWDGDHWVALTGQRCACGCGVRIAVGDEISVDRDRRIRRVSCQAGLSSQPPDATFGRIPVPAPREEVTAGPHRSA